MAGYAIFLLVFVGVLLYVGRVLWVHKDEHNLPHPIQPQLHKRLFVEPSPPKVEEWANTIPNDGLIQYHGVLGKKRTLVTSARGAHDILVRHPYTFHKPAAITKILRSVLGDGLVTAEGDTHRSQRRLLQQAFKFRSVKDLQPLFWRKTQTLIRRLQGMTSRNSIVNIAEPINQFTLDAIAAGGFGLDVNSLENPQGTFYSEYMTAFMPSKHAQAYRLLALILPERVLDWLPIKRNQELRRATRAVRSMIGDSVRSRACSFDSKDQKEGQKDILGILMEGSQSASTDFLVQQSLTMLGAGHDTVAQSLNWAIIELCWHQDVQTRLREEIRGALSRPISSIDATSEELNAITSLPYLNAVCQETFRCHPPVHHLYRDAVEDVSVGGQMMRRGTSFSISIRALNRSPKIWGDDAQKFRPERWLDDTSGGAEDRNAFMSFSQGPRACIGERLGRTEMALVLAGLVGCFELSLSDNGESASEPDNIAVEYGTTTRLARGLHVRAIPIEQ